MPVTNHFMAFRRGRMVRGVCLELSSVSPCHSHYRRLPHQSTQSVAIKPCTLIHGVLPAHTSNS